MRMTDHEIAKRRQWNETLKVKTTRQIPNAQLGGDLLFNYLLTLTAHNSARLN